LPTAALFSHALKERKKWKFVLQDYNDIFYLVTVPNLFLTWYVLDHEGSDEIVVTTELKQQFLQKLEEIGIQFQFIVGPWGTRLTVRSGEV
jgi:hypothetical protein